MSGRRGPRVATLALVAILLPIAASELGAVPRRDPSEEPGIEGWADPGADAATLPEPSGTSQDSEAEAEIESEAEDDGTGTAADAEPTPVPADSDHLPPPADQVRIVVNIPARRLRLYRGETCLFDVPVGIGRRTYPEERGNTRTRVGTYRITSWHDDYRSRQYPVPWSRDPWLGVFGPHTAKLGPRASYQYLHGTAGPEWMGSWLVEKDPPEAAPPGTDPAPDLSFLANAEHGLSHGCVRLANTEIRKLRTLAPVGTEVRKIYCLVERVRIGEGETEDRYLPNVYLYRVPEPLGVFHPETGRLEGYRDPPDAMGPR